MQFCFYPTLEHSCRNVRNCPHLGGAAIGALVQIANNRDQTVEQLHRQLNAERERYVKLVDENTRLGKELAQAKLQSCDVYHEKAITLQALLIRHNGEWLVFLDDARVSPTNNLAERALRPLVVLRKITFGSRTDAGATRMAKLMTVAETSRRHGKRTRDIYYELYTPPPDKVLRSMYAVA